jgi:hypothetical protein
MIPAAPPPITSTSQWAKRRWYRSGSGCGTWVPMPAARRMMCSYVGQARAGAMNVL